MQVNLTAGPRLSTLRRPLAALHGRRGRIANLNDSAMWRSRDDRDAGRAEQFQGGFEAHIGPLPLFKLGDEPDADPAAFGELGATEPAVRTGAPEQWAETAGEHTIPRGLCLQSRVPARQCNPFMCQTLYVLFQAFGGRVAWRGSARCWRRAPGPYFAFG